MMKGSFEQWLTAGTSIIVAIIGLAIVAAIVSKGSDTTKVIKAGSSGFACLLCAVLRPVGIGCSADCQTEDVTSIFKPL